ncbi:MAG: hypothetical protein QM718_04840 [Steroidobacteraceae bacterium]
MSAQILFNPDQFKQEANEEFRRRLAAGRTLKIADMRGGERFDLSGAPFLRLVLVFEDGDTFTLETQDYVMEVDDQPAAFGSTRKH